MTKTALTEEEKETVKRSRKHFEWETEKNFLPPPHLLISEITDLFAIAAKQSVDNPAHLKKSRTAVIRFLARNESATQQELVAYSHLTAASLSVELAEMEKLELITRQKSETDARTLCIKITEKGKELNERLIEIFDGINAEMLDGISLSEQELISSLLVKMRNNILKKIETEEATK